MELTRSRLHRDDTSERAHDPAFTPMLRPAGKLSRSLSSHLAQAAERIRLSGRLKRLLFVSGPGDIWGTYGHWSAGQDDPSISSLAYSAQVYETAEEIGADLTVLSGEPLPLGLREGHVRFRHCRQNMPGGLRYHLAEVSYVLRVLGHALQTRADAVIVQRNLVHLWLFALFRLFGIRLFVSLHNTLWPMHRAPSRRERLIGRLNGWFFRCCAQVISVSSVIEQQVSQLAGPRFKRISVQTPQYTEKLANLFQPRLETKPLRQILYLGRIEDNKGVFLLLDAFAKIAHQHPWLRLQFLGTGSALEQLRSAIKDLPATVRARVDAPGHCNGAQVFHALGVSDLLVCPTTGDFSEGLAKTPLEAAIAGVPSLVSTVVPAAHLLGEAVEVFDADSVTALTESLDQLARDPARLAAMSRAAQDRRAVFFDRTQSLTSRLVYGMEQVIAPKAVSQSKSSEIAALG